MMQTWATVRCTDTFLDCVKKIMKICQGSQSFGQDPNLGPPKYEAVLPMQLLVFWALSIVQSLF
jgi:hypothetical protein